MVARKDRTRERYGRLMVLGLGEPHNGLVAWDCLCDCGKLITVTGNHLGSGGTRSCGCLVKDTRHSPITDRVGQRFGRLTVLRLGEGRTAGGGVRWVVLCDCGAEKQVNGNAMVTGNVQSCGCLVADTRHKTHGLSGSKEHKAWGAMKSRCNDPNNKRYANYGGRGIKVCQGWSDSFEQFLADVGPRPGPKRSLDRINNDLGYFPGNVRWATIQEQANNKRGVVSNAAADALKAEVEALRAELEKLRADPT